MNVKITSNFLLIATVAMIFTSAIGYANLATATNNEYGIFSQSGGDQEYLSNCLLNDGTDGPIQRFEPLGCSSGGNELYGGNFENPDEVGWD